MLPGILYSYYVADDACVPLLKLFMLHFVNIRASIMASLYKMTTEFGVLELKGTSLHKDSQQYNPTSMLSIPVGALSKLGERHFCPKIHV